MIEPIFEGARSRCKKHPLVPIGPKDYECKDCQVIRKKMSLKPPFSVLCERTHFGTNKGTIYTVVWIIRDGARDIDQHMSGYVLQAEGGGLCERVYSPDEFTPVDFLPEDYKKELSKAEDKKESLQSADWQDYAGG